MGLLKMGSLIKFIPTSVIIGFTFGIALTIFSTQINDLLGLGLKDVPADFVDKWIVYLKNMFSSNFHSIVISAISLVAILLWPKINKKIPGSLIAIIIATIVTISLNLNAPTIGSTYGAISSNLPAFQFPDINLDVILKLLPTAVTIALLAGIESLLSAVVADGRIGFKTESNAELIGQGVANIFSGLFGGIPATGAIARTAANVKNGGKSPISAIVHCITLLIILVVCMPYASMVPMASLAAILVIVSYNMVEKVEIQELYIKSKLDFSIMILTAILTIFTNLVVSIFVGIVASTIKDFVMKRFEEHSSEVA
jgi:SulP family sulfate permease